MVTVKTLDHVNIGTAAVAETARLFHRRPRTQRKAAISGHGHGGSDVDVRPRRPAGRPSPGPARRSPKTPTGRCAPDTGALHHVAFRCDGYDAMLARLARLGLAYRTRDIAPIGLRQLFVHEPNGVLLELNYRE